MNPNPNSHEPLIDSALIGLDLTAEHHLANCPCCQGEREKTEEALRQFAELQRDHASRPEGFWEEQEARIRQARSALRRRSPLTAVLAPALALALVLAGAVVARRQAQVRITPLQAPIVSDHDLLMEVERTVDNATPDALEPVALVSIDSEFTSVVPDKNNKKEFNSHAN